MSIRLYDICYCETRIKHMEKLTCGVVLTIASGRMNRMRNAAGVNLTSLHLLGQRVRSFVPRANWGVLTMDMKHSKAAKITPGGCGNKWSGECEGLVAGSKLPRAPASLCHEYFQLAVEA